MNVMKTSLTIIPMCPRERFSLYKSLSRHVLCYKKDWATLLHFIYFCYLLLVTKYLIPKLSVTTYLSTCVGGKSASTSTYGDRAPFWFGGGRRSREERIEVMHTRSLPSFGPHGCVKPYCCFVVCIAFLLGGTECYSTL